MNSVCYVTLLSRENMLIYVCVTRTRVADVKKTWALSANVLQFWLTASKTSCMYDRSGQMWK